MDSPHRRLRRIAVVVAALLALGGACGGSDDASGPPRGPSTTAVPTPTPVAGSEAGFIAFGDFGGGPAQDDVAVAMERWAAQHRVDALVTTGDNVYDHGEPEHFATQLDEPYAALREERPFWVTLGNHDVSRGFGDQQLDHLGLPDLPYARELPSIQLLFLDGNRPDAEQAEWLEARLREPGPPYRVVVFHQPAYSCGMHGPTAGVMAQWVPVFERHRVALVLAGHDHLYQRFTSKEVTYVVTGGGGRALYQFTEPCEFGDRLETFAEEHHFVAFELREGVLTGSAQAPDGRVLDRFEIRR